MASFRSIGGAVRCGTALAGIDPLDRARVLTLGDRADVLRYPLEGSLDGQRRGSGILREVERGGASDVRRGPGGAPHLGWAALVLGRSEEHTSELQSRQ